MQVETEVARRLAGPTGLLASVEYTKPASASPSETFASTSRTSVSLLTTLLSTLVSAMFFKICRVYEPTGTPGAATSSFTPGFCRS